MKTWKHEKNIFSYFHISKTWKHENMKTCIFSYFHIFFDMYFTFYCENMKTWKYAWKHENMKTCIFSYFRVPGNMKKYRLHIFIFFIFTSWCCPTTKSDNSHLVQAVRRASWEKRRRIISSATHSRQTSSHLLLIDIISSATTSSIAYTSSQWRRRWKKQLALM